MSECLCFLPSKIKRFVRHTLILGMLKIIDVGLRLFGYKRVCRYLLLSSPWPDPEIVNFTRAFSTARIVNHVASHTLGSAPCLRRSLLLWWLLRWDRISTELRVGLNQKGGHAWVEHHGQVINDRPDVAATYLIQYLDQLSPEEVSNLQ